MKCFFAKTLIFKDKKSTVIALCFSILFLAANLYGYSKSIWDCSTNSVILCSIIFVVAVLPVAELFLWLKRLINSKYIFKYKKLSRNDYIKYFIVVTLILWSVYFIFFLIYYPGLYIFDVDAQISTGLSNWHSIVHTLMLQYLYKFGLWLGNTNYAIAIFSIIQIVLFGLTISLVHLFLYKINLAFAIRIILIIATCFLPYFTLWPISITKDIIFSCFFVLFTICIYSWTLCKKTWLPWLFLLSIISVTGMLLFRNNGIYVVVCVLVVCLIVRSDYFWQFFVSVCLGLCLFLGINGFLIYKLNPVIFPPLNIVDTCYNQLGKIYKDKYDELSYEDKATLKNTLPNIEEYNPYNTDALRRYVVSSDIINKFLPVWFRFAIRYPLTCIHALIDTNIGNFYILSTITETKIYNYDPEVVDALYDGLYAKYHFVRSSFFPNLRDCYNSLFGDSIYENPFICRLLKSFQINIWIIIFSLLCSIIDKKGNIVAYTFIFAFLITIMFGPLTIYRYAMPIYYCAPIVLFSYAYQVNKCKEIK